MQKLLIVDHQPVFSAGVAKAIQGELDVIGTPSDANSGVAMTLDLRPDVVLMGIRMPGRCAFSATREIVEESVHGARVLMWTGDVHLSHADRAFRAGSLGIASKVTERTDELASILRRVADGYEYVSRPWYARWLAILEGAELMPASLLTDEEVAALKLHAEGRTNAEAAEELEVSVRTVAYALSKCRSALNAHNSALLVRSAIAEGLVFPELTPGQK